MVCVQIAQLREATTADHEAVEKSIPLLGNNLTMAIYLGTLEQMFPFISAWEIFARDSAPPDMVSLVTARQRSHLLEADIFALGGRLRRCEHVALPELSGSSAFLGAMYVMEGSRLGGQIIAQHVDTKLSLRSDKGTSYFYGFGAKTGGMWKELISHMETSIPDTEAASIISAAKAMFQAFGRWMVLSDAVSAAHHTEVGEDERG